MYQNNIYLCEFKNGENRKFKEYMKDRIAHIIRAKNLTASEFATLLGVQPSGVSHILSGRNNPSLDFVKRIKDCFPEYNLDWLVLGTGPMTGSDPRPITPSLFNTTETIRTDDAPSNLTTNPIPPTDPSSNNDLSGTLFDMDIPHNSVDNQANTSSSLSEINPTNETIAPLTSRSHIKSIIVLYDDGTFESYQPRS